jgi:nicotinate-nucleotide adenylyltransferase
MKRKKLRIGVFGGCFDPIHLGHLLVAEDVFRQLKLDRLLFIPSFQPPHRPAPVAPYPHRAAMVELAIKYHPQFVLSRIEENDPGPSYTINTLRSLKRLFPGDLIYLIVGYDQYRTIKTWHQSSELTKLARLVVISRPNIKRPARFAGHAPNRVIFLKVIPVAIAAAQIRQRLASRMSIRYLVPTAVAQYIYHHRLYLIKKNSSTKQRRQYV